MCKSCTANPHNDGHPLLELGPWSRKKLFHLEYYAKLFSTGMKFIWKERAYIDLFAGPGLYLVRTRPPQVVDGSPLRALKQDDPFSHYVFVDSDPTHTRALEQRIVGLAEGSSKRVLPGNCNDPAVLSEILRFVPRRALCLTFIDPFAFNIEFNTLRELTKARRTDIILVFQTGGLKRAVDSGTASVDGFFGDRGQWRSVYESALPSSRTRALLDYYRGQLSQLGYLRDYYPSEVPVTNTRSVPLYHLVFASKHRRGKDFWNKSIQQTEDGMRRMAGF